jgi:hypothetical protein
VSKIAFQAKSLSEFSTQKQEVYLLVASDYTWLSIFGEGYSVAADSFAGDFRLIILNHE